MSILICDFRSLISIETLNRGDSSNQNQKSQIKNQK